MMKTMLMIMIVMKMKMMKTLIIYDNNDDDDTAGSMLWNQWCERKANAMDFHQNEVGAH